MSSRREAGGSGRFKTASAAIETLNLNSSLGFSRRAAEAAENAEKAPKTEAFRSPRTDVTKKRIHPNDESPSCSGEPFFFLVPPVFFVPFAFFVAETEFQQR